MSVGTGVQDGSSGGMAAVDEHASTEPRSKKLNTGTSGTRLNPSRLVKRRRLLTDWTMSSGPAATHGSGGSKPAVASPIPAQPPTEAAAGAPLVVAWTGAGATAPAVSEPASVSARGPRPALPLPGAWRSPGSPPGASVVSGRTPWPQIGRASW